MSGQLRLIISVHLAFWSDAILCFFTLTAHFIWEQRAVFSVTSWTWVVTEPPAALDLAAASSMRFNGPAVGPRAPIAPIPVYIFRVAACWSEKSWLAIALPRLFAVTVFAFPVGDAFGALLTLPTRFAMTRLGGGAITIGLVTSDFADWNVTVSATITAVTFALKWPVHTTPIVAALRFPTFSAIGTEPTRVTRAHSGHDTFTIHAIFTNRYFTSHSCPAIFTLTLEWFGAVAVDATWKLDALVTPRPRPSDGTLAGVWFGAVSMFAILTLRASTQGHPTHGSGIIPAGKALHSAITLAIVVAVGVFEVFWSACKLEVLVNLSVGPGIGHVCTTHNQCHHQ